MPKIPAVVLAASFAISCTQATDGVELVGIRADGLRVDCRPDAEDRYACDADADSGPSAGGANGGDGGNGMKSDGGPAVEDGCASWTDAGPALVLWPPNHKLEIVTLDDCARVRSACSAASATAAAGHIVSVTSDEPLDGVGDGHTTSGDLAIAGPRSVRLRSERKGGGDGRVYRIESVDDAGHHDLCEVHVPHDRGPYGGAHDSGEAVRIR